MQSDRWFHRRGRRVASCKCLIRPGNRSISSTNVVLLVVILVVILSQKLLYIPQTNSLLCPCSSPYTWIWTVLLLLRSLMSACNEAIAGFIMKSLAGRVDLCPSNQSTIYTRRRRYNDQVPWSGVTDQPRPAATGRSIEYHRRQYSLRNDLAVSTDPRNSISSSSAAVKQRSQVK